MTPDATNGPPTRGLIACDLDGTLLHSDGTLSPRTAVGIRRVVDAGWLFAIVTARPARRVLHIAEAVGLPGIALCSNGAIIFDVRTRELVADHPIQPEAAAALIHRLRQSIPGVSFAFELGLVYGREEAYVRRAETSDPDPPMTRIGDALELASSPVHKLIVAQPEVDFNHLVRGVREVAAGGFEVTHSSHDFVEVSARGVDKASGLRTLAEQVGVEAADVVAIGDMPNDLPMLSWAGMAVAVGNAHPDVLTAAHRIVATNDDDGVADVLDGLT